MSLQTVGNKSQNIINLIIKKVCFHLIMRLYAYAYIYIYIVVLLRMLSSETISSVFSSNTHMYMYIYMYINHMFVVKVCFKKLQSTSIYIIRLGWEAESCFSWFKKEFGKNIVIHK